MSERRELGIYVLHLDSGFGFCSRKHRFTFYSCSLVSHRFVRFKIHGVMSENCQRFAIRNRLFYTTKNLRQLSFEVLFYMTELSA